MPPYLQSIKTLRRGYPVGAGMIMIYSLDMSPNVRMFPFDREADTYRTHRHQYKMYEGFIKNTKPKNRLIREEFYAETAFKNLVNHKNE